MTTIKSMTKEEIANAGNKFMAYLAANGVSGIYLAISFKDGDSRAHSSYIAGPNAIELIGITHVLSREAMNFLDKQIASQDKSGFRPVEPPAK